MQHNLFVFNSEYTPMEKNAYVYKVTHCKMFHFLEETPDKRHSKQMGYVQKWIHKSYKTDYIFKQFWVVLVFFNFFF